jgi:hypothetical protein
MNLPVVLSRFVEVRSPIASLRSWLNAETREPVPECKKAKCGEILQTE